MQSAWGTLRVRLAADAASVPAARRFVVDGLTAWGDVELLEAAELVASELSSNAALHASAEFMHVTLERGDGTPGVRVAVEDDGPVGADAVRERALEVAVDHPWAELEATGRGLAIVAMVAARWGVDELTGGKRVWADLVDAGAPYDVRAPERVHLTEPTAPSEELPPGWVLVRLERCPVRLSLQQDRHLDELVRELQLLSVDDGNSVSTALAAEIRALLVSPTSARLTGRKAAERARDEGRDEVDVEMAMPREFSGLVTQLQEAVTRADRLCEEGRLLTLASPPDIRAIRAWMTHEIVEQATRGASPVPWPDWLAAS